MGILLTPIFGIGLIILYRTYTARKAVVYKVTDRSIQLEDSAYSENIDLVNITDVSYSQRWIDRKFNIGDLTLKTDSRTVIMLGQINPSGLSEMIMRAAESERKRISALQQKPKPKPAGKPGTLDKLDYLIGLWQQGLLSEEDYQNEKKHSE